MKPTGRPMALPHAKTAPIADEAGPTGFSTDTELFEAMIAGYDVEMVADSFELLAGGAPILEATSNLNEIWASMMVDPKYRKVAAEAGAGKQLQTPGLTWAAS